MMVSVPYINLQFPSLKLTMQKGPSRKSDAEIIFTWQCCETEKRQSFWVDEESFYVEEAREFLIDTWIQETFPMYYAMIVGDYKKVKDLMLKIPTDAF